MTLPFRRGSRPRGQARLALTGDFPGTDRDITAELARTEPADWDGTTIDFTGASGTGLPGGIAYDAATGRTAGPAFPDGITAIAIKMTGHDTEPLRRLRAQPAPRQHILAPVPVTEPAVIGDDLRLPVIWCEMPSCISWHHDPDAAGERDARDRAAAAGWRTDALGRLACPDCQQARPDYRTPQPVAWHHPKVARQWHEHGRPLREEDAFRLGAEAELGRRVSRENPALARAIAGATARHHHQAVTS